MSLEVFFDGIQINEQYYTGLNNNFELFNESFKLGATPCNTYKLTIAKEGVVTQPSQVELKDNGVTFANLDIDNIEEQDYTYVYTLTDKMVNLEFYYDASQIFQNGFTTLYNIVVDICNKVGLTLGTSDFRGYNKAISWYDNTRTARQYIGYVAELNGGFARIENNTLYFVKQKTNSKRTISIEDCDSFKIGEYHKITRVVYELGTLKYEFGNETGNTLYLDGENVFITEESEVEAIYNDIKDFEFYSFTTDNCPIDYEIKAGDIITFSDGTNEYPTIAQYDLEYFGGWYGGYDLSINTEKQEETKVIGEKEKIKNLQIIVDRQNNTITQMVEEVGEQNTKINQVRQTVDELNSKISDIADITSSQETTRGRLIFEKINQSEPIRIEIRPISDNISYLYPRDNLFPADDLYLTDRTLRFTNTTTSEVFDYELPDDLLYYDAEHYDEFILDYEGQSCFINKKCEYNSNGEVVIKSQEVIEEFAFPHEQLQLTDGDYTVEILKYETTPYQAYLFARMMVQNYYTTQFATRAEMNSKISQTSSNVLTTVNAKFTNYSTTTEMNGAINVKANEITSQVSENYATKNELNTAKTEIKQTTDSITTTVSKKVGDNEIISKINQSSETVGINADKIKLTANDILNLIADNEINLTSKNITIKSDRFSVNKNGGITINDLDSYSTQNCFVIKKNGTTKMYMNAYGMYWTEGVGIVGGMIGLGDTQNEWINMFKNYIQVGNQSNETYITANKVETPQVIQTSLEGIKKNISNLQIKALDIIKNSNIYEYNLKSEEDTSKKHIGFVIGEKYNTPTEVISIDGKGIDTYTMASIMWKAIQELSEKIKE